MTENYTNGECPDFQSHIENAADVLFPAADRATVFAGANWDAIEKMAEAEYRCCEGHA